MSQHIVYELTEENFMETMKNYGRKNELRFSDGLSWWWILILRRLYRIYHRK